MSSKRKLITEKDIADLILRGKNKLEISGTEIFTPAANDKIRTANIKVEKAYKSTATTVVNKSDPVPNAKKIVIGSDHTGFKTKQVVIKFLESFKFDVEDVGTLNEESCDYPDFAIKVSKKIIAKEADFGIVLDATGIPSAITANKLDGIRAATCYNEFSARSAREHNNANVLVMGAKTLGEETIKSIIEVWLQSKFLGDRHLKRLDKITALEAENKSKNK